MNWAKRSSEKDHIPVLMVCLRLRMYQLHESNNQSINESMNESVTLP